MSDEVRFRIVIDDNGVAPAMHRTTDGFARMGTAAQVSSGQTQQAMRMLPAQLSDVATQIAGGQSPFLVLMQQGLQTRDMFGSFRAAGAGILAALTPATVAVGALLTTTVAAAAAALQGDREWSQFRNTLALSGNAAGLTADRLDALSRSVSQNSGATVGQAREITLALAAQGTVSARVLDDMALAVARVADASGQDAKTVAADFAKMRDGVADWAASHNKAWNFISAEQYKYIKRLEDQGKAEEAMIFVSKRAIEQHDAQRQSLGYVERAWENAGKAASAAWKYFLGWGAPDTLKQQLEKVTQQVRDFEANMPGANSTMVSSERRAEIEAQLRALKDEQIRLIRQIDREQANADDRSIRAATEQAKIAKLRDDEKKKGGASRSELKNYNPAGMLVGPEYLSPDDLRRQFRQAEIAAMDATNLDADIRANKIADERLRRQQQLLDELTGANARANVELIADDQQRALAQIELERKQLQVRIDAIYGSSSARAEAERQADEAAGAQRAAVSQRFAKDTGLVTYEETRDALANAFRDTKNPLRAFGDALGNIVFQRVTSRLADALVTGAMGSGGGFGGGLLGSLFSVFSGGPASLLAGATGFGDYNMVAGLAGARAYGGPVMPGKAYLVGERGPEILRMGGQGGMVIPNNAIGGPSVTINQVLNIGQGVSVAQVSRAAMEAKEAAKSEVLQLLQRDRIV